MQKKNHVEHFFQFFMLNISPIKELLYKPAKIQTNIAGALHGKLKKNPWALSYKILPPEITKMLEIPILGLLWGLQTQCGIPMFFLFFSFLFLILSISESFSFYLLVKNSFNFKLGFFSYFEYISGGIIRKNI